MLHTAQDPVLRTGRRLQARLKDGAAGPLPPLLVSGRFRSAYCGLALTNPLRRPASTYVVAMASTPLSSTVATATPETYEVPLFLLEVV